MKRVLWVCNIMLPAIGQELNLPYSNREGWLSGIFERVQRQRDASFRLGIGFPREGRPLRRAATSRGGPGLTERKRRG